MDSLDPINLRMQNDIDKWGWHAVGVGADPKEDTTQFLYTVGFAEKGQPELILFGMGFNQMHGCAAILYHRTFNEKLPLREGQRDDVLEGYDVELRRMHESWWEIYPPSLAMRRAEGRLDSELRTLVVVWPDAQGRFPWDEGFSMPGRQPPVWEPRCHPDCGPIDV